MIEISIDFVDKEKFEHLIRSISSNELYGEMQIQAQILAHHCADYMREHIESERKRPDKGTHHLENAILAEPISTSGGIEYGIGRITTLQKEAWYFELINDGGTVINPNNKDTYRFQFEDGQWRTFVKGSEHKIHGIDYVGYAMKKIEHEITEITLKNINQSVDRIMGRA